MTGKRDRLFPVAYAWLDSLHNDRCTENSSVKNRTDRTVRTLVHLLQIVFIHTCMIRCNCRTFYCNAIFLRSFCCIDRYLIVCLITIIQSKIVVLCIQINKRKKELILDHLPEDSCHLVSVHFYQRCRHLNFFHNTSPLLDI